MEFTRHEGIGSYIKKTVYIPKLVRQESHPMNCQCAAPSIWGNLTGMCFNSNAEVQSFRDNVSKPENPIQAIR